MAGCPNRVPAPSFAGAGVPESAEALVCPADTRESREGLVQRCVDGRGQGHGPERVWSTTGVLLQAGERVQGRPVGLWRTNHPDGSPSEEGAYDVDGLKTGVWKVYGEGGTVWIEGTWAHGVEEGPWIERYPGGVTEREGQHKDGARDGTWTFNHPTGRVRRIAIYDEGALDTETCQSAEGVPLLCSGSED